MDWARRTELAAIVLGVFLSSLIAATGIWYSNNQVRDQLKISSQELNTTQEGQITEPCQGRAQLINALRERVLGPRLWPLAVVLCMIGASALRGGKEVPCRLQTSR